MNDPLISFAHARCVAASQAYRVSPNATQEKVNWPQCNRNGRSEPRQNIYISYVRQFRMCVWRKALPFQWQVISRASTCKQVRNIKMRNYYHILIDLCLLLIKISLNVRMKTSTKIAAKWPRSWNDFHFIHIFIAISQPNDCAHYTLTNQFGVNGF